MTFPTEVSIPMLKDVKAQVPKAVCEVAPNNVSTNIIINSSAPPFDSLDVRRALALALDRKAFVSIIFEGQADIGGTVQTGSGRIMGNAEGDDGDHSRLRSRYREANRAERAS